MEFPYAAYQCQLVYMERVIQSLQENKHALLESPTGTGKTLCLLCATLSWRRHHLSKLQGEAAAFSSGDSASQLPQAKAAVTLPPIVYSSRTHSQLSQVVKELKTTSFRPRVAILGSRSQLCVNPEVRNIRETSRQNQACRRKTSSMSCQHYANYLRFPQQLPSSSSSSSSFSSASELAAQWTDQINDIEDLVKLGEALHMCPYFTSRKLQLEAPGPDILFVPYNYILDPGVRAVSLPSEFFRNAVVIFDEAHNLESVCRDATSFDLSEDDFDSAITLLDTCKLMARSQPGSTDPDEFAAVAAAIAKLSKQLKGIKINPSSSSSSSSSTSSFSSSYSSRASASAPKGQKMTTADLHTYFARAGITIDSYHKFATALDAGSSLLLDPTGDGRGGGDTNASTPLENIAASLRLMFEDALNTGSDSSRHFQAYVHETLAEGGLPGPRMLSYWCLSPGIAMSRLLSQGIRSMILTSGTLSPLDSYAGEMMIDFQVQLENPHVIQPSQIFVQVLTSGPTGGTLNSSYQNRGSLKYQEELGNTLVNYCRIVPDGVLVFFPSYLVLNMCINAWKAPAQQPQSSLTYGRPAASGPTIWDRIAKLKRPIVEPRQSSQLQAAMADFYAHLETSTGAIFFAVCRGKVSEGLDFANKNGRAVIV
ncbi:MAG: helicase C-terminal domain-containing protein, partial [archaeon]|nr:helicase C-terminal domain-containing protein [archaeon]